MTLWIAPVRQHVSAGTSEDIPGEVRAGMRRLHSRVRHGMRIAVGVGSRGISGLPTVVHCVVEELRALGADPFLVPAMGSHGGGTAEGQREVLERYGLRPTDLGVSIRSAMETVEIGRTPEGMPVFFDSHAAAADGIIVINRIKEHTAFKGRWESGLLKMLAVGLGKARGAAEIHNWGVREAMPSAARLLLARLPILGGVALIENGVHELAKIVVLPAEQIEAEEPALLDLARRLTPRIPFEPIDLLLVREMGKDISGTGMDLNVIGMWRRTGGPIEPLITTIGVLDLTENSHGNAIGVGHADLIPQRFYTKTDRAATCTNCLTSHNLTGGKIPITLPTDRAVVEAGLAGIAPERARGADPQHAGARPLVGVAGIAGRRRGRIEHRADRASAPPPL
ncbi:MAG: DUF362 domain-containing protein [Ardenticatenaceae bacterium]|nr:DUF362 domain-containing protein [Ardenticatenaceae bacterium]